MADVAWTEPMLSYAPNRPEDCAITIDTCVDAKAGRARRARARGLRAVVELPPASLAVMVFGAGDHLTVSLPMAGIAFPP